MQEPERAASNEPLLGTLTGGSSDRITPIHRRSTRDDHPEAPACKRTSDSNFLFRPHGRWLTALDSLSQSYERMTSAKFLNVFLLPLMCK